MAAKTDPLNLNNMSPEDAKKLIIRSVSVQDADMDTVFQLPATTWIGGKVMNEAAINHLPLGTDMTFTLAKKHLFLYASDVYFDKNSSVQFLCKRFPFMKRFIGLLQVKQ